MYKRIEILDTLRGLAVILMVIYHIFFDLYLFSYIPEETLFRMPVKFFQFSACMFIVIAGICCNFSKNNFRRGGAVLLIAMVFTAVTALIDMPIKFGILHFLGVCMVLYAAFEKHIEKIDGRIGIVFCTVLFFITKYITDNIIVESKLLFPFGFVYDGFFSADYYPVFPWIFLFIIGVYLGGYFKKGKISEKICDINVPLLSVIGRKSLIIYIVHQPIIYGAFILISKI